MRICNYCGRGFRKDIESCPGCGSNSFTEHPNRGEYVITTPPKRGYSIRTTYYTQNLLMVTLLVILDFFVALSFTRAVVDEVIHYGFITAINDLIANWFILLFIIIPILLIVWGLGKMNELNEKIAKLRIISFNGVLVKHLPYTLEQISEKQYLIKIEYETPSGQMINLVSEPKGDDFIHDADGKADLLIDPNDYSNFFIEVNIE